MALVAITCLNDRPSGPGGRARTSISLHRIARGGFSCGQAPTIKLTKARIVLKDPARGDSTFAVGSFNTDTVTLTLDLPLTGARALLDIYAQTIDSTGDTVFRAQDTVTAVAGQRTVVNYLKLWYAAPDSIVDGISLAPRDTMVHANAAFAMHTTAYYDDGSTFSGHLRLGFLSRDPTIATVSQSGQITATSKTGSTYIVASTWLGFCDSTTVSVVPPVASVDVKPDTADIARDDTLRFVVTLKDGAGNILTGRPVTWGVTNANATVDTTGLVKALIANKSVRVFANSEGKADSSGIGVLGKPVKKVTVAPKPGAVQVGSTLQMSASAVDSQNVADPDWPTVWSTLDATLATINGTGLVTGVKAGTVGIVATIDGVADTSQVTVTPNGPTKTVVTPNPDTAFSINDTLQLTAQAYIGNNPTNGSFTWVSRDPTVVTVNSSGQVIAKANGSTYVVATEAGGTKDSSHVFVIQRVSSISVTPNPVQRYLGTNQTFTASGADARGNAMSGLTFTWSQSDPSITNLNANTGAASMIAIGTDTIKATVGTVVGKALLTAKTAITKITVTPAGITLTALQQTQAYSATAYDTLNNAMSGITFAWTSTNPSVASVPGTPGTTQTATALANGTTAITATAQGASGASTLTVAQALVTIAAGPNPTAVGVNGQAQLTARGKDANGFFIPGGNFAWSSDAPTNVSVVAATGLVKGLILNTSAHITAVSGTITSNQVLVNVTNAVPPHVSFGRDTLAIGRGSLNNSIPVYLNTPPANGVTITVAVKDTIAYFSPVTVVFNPGVTSQNANLNGRNAGVTQVTATDGGGLYSPDTAVLLVQATAKFAFGSVTVNATDFYSTQVLLSDPAPAGGVYLAMNYGTAGVAQVSPDPAFINAGQLAANVNVNGLAAGTTTVTPSALGVAGTSSTVTVQAAKLAISSSYTTVGAGQYDNSTYAQVPATLFHPLTVGLASTDTTIANEAPSVVIPSGISYAYFTTFGLKIGSVTQTASAPGWTSGTRTQIVTTPYLRACCNTTINTTSSAQSVTAYTEDSIGYQHPRINPLFVTLTSTDTSILQVIDTTIAVAANQSSKSGRYQPAGNGGVAYIRVSAGGHVSDSIQVTVTAPNLVFGYGTTSDIGTDQQQASYAYIQIPNAVSHAVTVNLASSDTTIVWATPLFTIPTGSTYAYFDIRGHRLGIATLTATAQGYTAVAKPVTVATPRLSLCCAQNVPNFYPDQVITAYTQDSTFYYRPVIHALNVSLKSTNTQVVTVDSSVITVPAGSYNVSKAKLHFVGVGVAQIVSTAPGYVPDTMNVTVSTPNLASSSSYPSVGRRQTLLQSQYVYTPNARVDSVVVQVANQNPRFMSAPDSIKIPKNLNYAYYDLNGLNLGKDTLTFSSAGYNPVKQGWVITPPQLHFCCLQANYNTTSPPVTINAGAYDTVGYQHYTMDTVTVHVVSTDTTVFKVDSAYIHINKGQASSTSNTVRFVGPGTAKVLYTDSVGLYKPDSSVAVTVTGPALFFSYGTNINSPLTVGMRQHTGAGGQVVYVQNAVTGSPLTINLVSTDPTVATVVASVTIPVGQSAANLDVTGHDTIGTIQLKATATGYSQALSYVQVGQPQFIVSATTSAVTTTPPQNVTVYAYDQGNQPRYTTEDVSVTLTSANPSVAAMDSATITIKKDNYYTNVAKMHYLSPGTTTLTASDARVAFYKYTPYTTSTITVALPTVQLNLPSTLTLGLDQYYDTQVSIPNSLSSPLTVSFGHTSGASTTPASVVIPTGQYSANYRVTGAARGNDVVSVSAPGNNGTSATVQVDSGLIVISNWPASVKAGDSVAVTIYSEDLGGNARYLSIPVTFTLAPNANIVFDQGGAVTTSITIPAGQYNSASFFVKGVSAGTGSVTVKGGRFSTYTNTLTVTP